MMKHAALVYERKFRDVGERKNVRKRNDSKMELHQACLRLGAIPQFGCSCDYLATVITGVNLIPFRVVSETGEYS